MSDSTNVRKRVVPYAAWRTFRSFLGDLVTKGTPSRIDHTVMTGKSGSVQSAIRKTLQFLDLTDASNTPTDKLQSLLGALDTDEWAPALKRVVLDAYGPIVEDLDMETGTAQQLAECFRTRGHVSGNTLTMAVRFFLGALKDAGVKHSGYFAAPPRPPSKKRGTPKTADDDEGRAAKTDGSGTPKPDAHGANSGPGRPESPWQAQPFLLPTRSDPILLKAPKDLSLAEWAIIDAFVRGMIQLGGDSMPPSSVDTENGG